MFLQEHRSMTCLDGALPPLSLTHLKQVQEQAEEPLSWGASSYLNCQQVNSSQGMIREGEYRESPFNSLHLLLGARGKGNRKVRSHVLQELALCGCGQPAPRPGRLPGAQQQTLPSHHGSLSSHPCHDLFQHRHIYMISI